MKLVDPPSIDRLLSFGVKDISKALRPRGETLLSLEDHFSRYPGGGLTLRVDWKRRNPFSLETVSNSIQAEIKKLPEAFYLILRYTFRGKEKEIYYPLVKRESNLKPGTYRYYIKDHYTPGRLCSKLYLNPETGDFVSRSVLRSFGLLYSIQRKGHKERYFYNPRRIPDTRYRKSHYRGRITPFWDMYERLQEREEERFIEFSVGLGYSRGILSREIERAVMADFRERTGKSLPRRP